MTDVFSKGIFTFIKVYIRQQILIPASLLSVNWLHIGYKQIVIRFQQEYKWTVYVYALLSIEIFNFIKVYIRQQILITASLLSVNWNHIEYKQIVIWF